MPHVLVRASATRRSALAAALGLSAVAAGCAASPDPPDGAGAGAGSAPGSAAGSGSPSAGEDPDRSLVDGVLAELAAAQQLVATTRREFPGLADALAPLQRLHAQHARALDGPAQPPRRPAVPGSAGQARRRVRAAEERLQRSLTDAAVQAASGDLAALLAAMAAAVAQQRVAL